MNVPKNIIVHHTAVSREKNSNQFEATDNYHKSKGWGKIGYQYLIEPDGTVKQGRADNELGAHTSQKNMNYLSLGICLTGDFDIEEPTKEQCIALQELIRRKQTEYTILDANVVPHRHYAPKSCWGNKLPTDILSYLTKRTMADTQQLADWQNTAIQFIKDTGISDGSRPLETVTRVEMFEMIRKFYLYTVNKK